MRFTLVPGFSKASYRAREQLRAINFPTEAVGSTREVTGGVVLDASGAVRSDDSRITADLRSLRSDEPIRDNYIQENTLQTAQFPTAEFRLTEVRGVPRPIPTGTDVNVELVGDLTVHGTARPVVWVGSARLDDHTLTGAVSTHVTITEFGMNLPSVFRVLTLEDALTLELAFQARSEAILAP
jgi:polyisoprenoid-binding protein YceI